MYLAYKILSSLKILFDKLLIKFIRAVHKLCCLIDIRNWTTSERRVSHRKIVSRRTSQRFLNVAAMIF